MVNVCQIFLFYSLIILFIAVSLNFLNLSISYNTPKFSLNMFRKSTYIYKVIPYDFTHTYSQYISAFHFMDHTALSIFLYPQNLQFEIHTINTSATINSYYHKIVDNILIIPPISTPITPLVNHYVIRN